MKITHLFATVAICLMIGACDGGQRIVNRSPVDYVNPYIGNISHLLVPTFPTIQLPNSMLRVYPERADYTTSERTSTDRYQSSGTFRIQPQPLSRRNTPPDHHFQLR